MSMDRSSSLETKRAMFWAALAAQCAGETVVTRNRIVAALLRAGSVRELCSRARIDSARLLDAVDDPQALSFEECERRVRGELTTKAIELGSEEHRSGVQLRPMEPVAREVFDGIIERQGHIGVAALELLLALIRADPVLAQRLAPHGLTAQAIPDAAGEGY
jgi:hypothetical protein